MNAPITSNSSNPARKSAAEPGGDVASTSLDAASSLGCERNENLSTVSATSDADYYEHVPAQIPWRLEGGHECLASIRAFLFDSGTESRSTWGTSILAMGALSQLVAEHSGHIACRLPFLGSRDWRLALLVGELVDAKQSLYLTPEEAEEAMDDGDYTIFFSYALLKSFHHLASLQVVNGGVIVKDSPKPSARYLRYVPEHGVGIDGTHPELPATQSSAAQLVTEIFPPISAFAEAISLRWQQESVGVQNAKTHDFVRWMWLVADALGLSCVELEELSWALHSVAYCDHQTGSLLLRL